MFDPADDDQFEAPSTDATPPKKRGQGVRVLLIEREGVLGKECRACGSEWLPLDAFYKHPKAAGGRGPQCRVCHTAASTRWQIDNPERVKINDARRRAAHPERKKFTDARWAKNNPDKVAAIQALRLARFLEAGPDLPHHIKLQVWEAAEGRCEYCGVPVPAPHAWSQMEHRVPLSRGGDNSLANRGVACQRCQTRKGTRTLSEWVDYCHLIALAKAT